MTTDPASLSRWRTRLTGLAAKDEVDALLADDQAAALVAALPVTTLHQLVHDVGFVDAQDLIALATPEQLQGCLDLDAWDRDRAELDALMPWLVAIVEAGYEKLAQVWHHLDSEFTALFLARTTVIYDLSLGEEPDDADGDPIFTTPDSFFAIKLVANERDVAALVHRLIDDLYRADPSGQLCRHTLMAARSEPLDSLEEMSYRWRSGRMADLGYADFYEALEVFRPLDPESVHIGEKSEDRFADAPGDAHGGLPALMAERMARTRFLSRALDHIDDASEVERLEIAFLVLFNKVLAAARISPGEREARALAAEHASATVSLGLEAVSRGNLDRALQALATVSLTRLHRAGHTLTLRLSRLARALAPRAVTAAEPAPSLLAALLGRRPLYTGMLDDPPGAGVRPFASLADIKRAADELTRLAMRVAIADALGVDLVAAAQAPEPRPDLDDAVRTALVHAMLGEPFTPEPLTVPDLARFARTCLVSGHLAEPAREHAGKELLGLLDRGKVAAARHLLPALLTAWLDELAGLAAQAESAAHGLDPRFVAGVLLAAGSD